jgi:hypothetical protein
MKKKLKVKKLIYPILFSFFIFFLISSSFLKTNFVYSFGGGGGGGGQSSQQQCPYYRPIPYDQIPQALAIYISQIDQSAGGSKVLNDYLRKRGISALWVNDQIFKEILNPLGSNKPENVQIFSDPLRPDSPPPNHTKVSRTSKIFYILATTTVQEIDTNGDGTKDYTAKGSLLYLHEVDLFQELIYKNLEESDFQQKTDVLMELYDFAEYVPCPSSEGGGGGDREPGPGGGSFIILNKVLAQGGEGGDGWSGDQTPPNYQLFKINVSQGSDFGVTTTPFTNIIFNIRKPECRQWTDKGLFTNRHHVECRMDALAPNGQLGNGYYHDSAQQKNLLGFILVIFLGLFLAYLAPVYMGFGYAWLGVEAFINIFYFGNFIALGGVLAASLTTSSFATIASILENATYGTTDQPAGGLERFSWSCPYTDQRGFCPPFGSSPISCSLTASPTSKDAPPLTVTFNLTGNGTLESWDGPCSLENPPSSCSYTYTQAGTYGPYTAKLQEGPSCSSPKIIVGQEETTFYDFVITSFNIRTFICKNKDFDSNLSYLNEYLSRNPNYMFAPSTTYANEFYNKVAKNTCPESQRNRPVEFSATGECVSIFRDRPCPPSKLRIYIRPAYGFWPEQEREIKEFTTSYDSSYPKSIKGEYIFNKPYDYLVTACFVDENNRTIQDANPLNTCKEQTLRIFDYMCMLGFCAQNQRDIENPSSVFNFEPMMYKILKVFGDTDSPCRFYRNEICRARFGF